MANGSACTPRRAASRLEDRSKTCEIRILLGDEDPNRVGNVDGFVDLDDGTPRTFTVLTIADADPTTLDGAKH